MAIPKIYNTDTQQWEPVSPGPYSMPASGVSFTSSGLAVISGTSDVQAALEAADVALADRPTTQEVEDYVDEGHRGLVHRHLETENSSNVGSTETAVWSTLQVDLPPGRLVKITMRGSSFTGVGGDGMPSGIRRCRARLREGTDTSGDQVLQVQIMTASGWSFSGSGTTVVDTGAGGVTDYRVTLQQVQGSNEVRLNASEADPFEFIFEDVGPAPS